MVGLYIAFSKQCNIVLEFKKMHSKHFLNYFLLEDAAAITTHLVFSLLLVWNKTETNGLNYGKTKGPMEDDYKVPKC